MTYTLQRGYTQLYTGDGKGKTTALVGLTCRALGAGLKVCFIQFMKGHASSEFQCLEQVDTQGGFEHHMFGTDRFIIGPPTQEECQRAQAGLQFAREAFKKFDVILLDEACCALEVGLFTLYELILLIKDKPLHVELVLSGRNAPQTLIDYVDLCSTVGMTKHYFNVGVEARLGIEF